MKILKNRASLKAIAGIAVTYSTLFLSATAANAVSFVLKDSNKAINVWLGSNAQYKFDGYPRAFVLEYNPSDREQRFNELRGNHGGNLYQVEGTNLCLNNGYNYNGAPINVWPCNPNDRDQNWQQINLGGSTHLKNVATGRCADSTSRVVSPNNFIAWDCGTGNPNQQFNVVGGSTPPPATVGKNCQCTAYVSQRFGNFPYPADAGDWHTNVLPQNRFRRINSPQNGAVVVMERSFPGSNRAYGHVGIVEQVFSDGRIAVRGANQPGVSQPAEAGCNNVTVYTFSTSVYGRNDISFWVR